MGVLFILTGLLIGLVFGAGADAGVESRLGLNPSRGDTFFGLPDIVVPSAGTAYVLSAVCLFLGGMQLVRGFGARLNVVLGIVVAVFVFSFLVWATQDGSLSLLGMLQSTLLRSVPITFGALSGVLCERSGVINIAIEGMLLFGAFAGSRRRERLWQPVDRPARAALSTGGVVAWGLALLAIRYRVDQIVAGTVINILALGLTSYLTSQYPGEEPRAEQPRPLPEHRDPAPGRHPPHRARSCSTTTSSCTCCS